MPNFLSVVFLILVTLVLPSAIVGVLVGILFMRCLFQRRSQAAHGK